MTTENGTAVDPAIVRRNAFKAAHDVADSINYATRNIGRVSARQPGKPGYEALRELLTQHYPSGNTASSLLGMWRDDLISIHVTVASYDKDGFFEGPDGCVRDNDKSTEHEKLSLRISTPALRLPDHLVPDPAEHPDARRAAARARVEAEGDDF